jgi:hypothetical protein
MTIWLFCINTLWGSGHSRMHKKGDKAKVQNFSMYIYIYTGIYHSLLWKNLLKPSLKLLYIYIYIP